MQLAGGMQSPWYFYDITNYGVAVGFFSNANHEATLLVATVPFLAALYLAATVKGRSAQHASGMLVILLTGWWGGVQQLLQRAGAYALERGHRITRFNRGRREVEWPAEVEELTGDRDTGDLAALAKGEWDVCIDNPTSVPHWVRDAGKALKGRVGQYIFISTISVYSDNSQPGQVETGALAQYAGADPMRETMASLRADMALYGPLKALSEREAAAQAADKTLTVMWRGATGEKPPTEPISIEPHQPVYLVLTDKDGAGTLEARRLVACGVGGLELGGGLQEHHHHWTHENADRSQRLQPTDHAEQGQQRVRFERSGAAQGHIQETRLVEQVGRKRRRVVDLRAVVDVVGGGLGHHAHHAHPYGVGECPAERHEPLHPLLQLLCQTALSVPRPTNAADRTPAPPDRGSASWSPRRARARCTCSRRWRGRPPSPRRSWCMRAARYGFTTICRRPRTCTACRSCW